MEGPKRNVSTQRKTYSHDIMHTKALNFIRQHSRKPFFLQAHYTIPHTNNEGGRATGNGQEVPDHGEFATKNWPEPEKGFAAMITRLDSDIGQMMTLLKTLSIDKKTLVIFTSDNGPHQEGGPPTTHAPPEGRRTPEQPPHAIVPCPMRRMKGNSRAEKKKAGPKPLAWK